MSILNMKCIYLYAALLLLIFSCKKDNEPSLTYDPAVLARQQAPFGIDTVTIKLKNIFFDGKLADKFYFSEGYLFMQKKVASFDSSKLTSTIDFTWIDSNLISAISRQTDLIWYEENYVSDTWVDKRLLEYIDPVNDSVRQINEHWFLNLTEAKSTFFFNAKGYVIRQEFTTPKTPSYSTVTTFIRNEKNNIETSIYENYVSGPTLRLYRQYKYDDKPNPFFRMGFDCYGDISVFSLSPNNITEITYTDDSKDSYVERYTYQYSNNGYPKRIEIKSSVNNSPPLVTHVMEFTYY